MSSSRLLIRVSRTVGGNQYTAEIDAVEALHRPHLIADNATYTTDAVWTDAWTDAVWECLTQAIRAEAARVFTEGASGALRDIS